MHRKKLSKKVTLYQNVCNILTWVTFNVSYIIYEDCRFLYIYGEDAFSGQSENLSNVTFRCLSHNNVTNVTCNFEAMVQ
jgi:hypothetical protein